MSKLGLPSALVLTLALSGCTSVEKTILPDRPTVVVEPGGTVSLTIGKSATVPGSQYRVTFRQVTEDSRCPINAVCVWEGRARIEIVVTGESTPAQSAILGLSPPDKNEARLGDLVVRFVSLAPPPETPQPPRTYVAELVISRLQ